MTEQLTCRPIYTAEEFEEDYGGDTELLRKFGRVVLPCDCDYEGCRGWQMGRTDAIDDYWWNKWWKK